MSKNMSQTNLNYRMNEVHAFFDFLTSGESCFFVGAPSAGKTRFVDFLTGDFLADNSFLGGKSLIEHYMGTEMTSKVWLVRVDMNRAEDDGEWGFGFSELLLSSLALASFKYDSDDELKQQIVSWDSQVIQSKDALQARRYLEWSITKLCHKYSLKICFLFDEFDITYKSLPTKVFSHLRAIRDANKYQLSYALFLRNLPDMLRDPNENESFYELLSRNIIGIGPYNLSDTTDMILNIERRRNLHFNDSQRTWIYEQSGGHPGLVSALCSVLIETPDKPLTEDASSWLLSQDYVQDELRKIWGGLLESEKNCLTQIISGQAGNVDANTRKLLIYKGLLTSDLLFFSPLLAPYLSKHKTQLQA